MTPLAAVLEATWPAARQFRRGPWVLRDGLGGGQRVSAATAEGPVTAQDLATLETEQRALGQPALVMVRAGEDALDALLTAQGYEIRDPTLFYAAPTASLAHPPAPVSAFPHWPRLAAAEEIWAAAGLGPARLAVMDRAAAPKSAILARTEDAPAGAGFVARHGDCAMIHAIEVLPRFRGKGTARNILRAAACWAQDVGATAFSLAVTEQNDAARALYASLGMRVVGHYHYRKKGARKEARAVERS